MSVFSNFPLRDDFLSKTLSIDISLYEKLEFLSKNKYDASISKLVNACLEGLIKDKKIDLYKRSKGEVVVSRSFLIKKTTYENLTKLKNEYAISLTKLINIAIFNALVEEKLIDKSNL